VLSGEPSVWYNLVSRVLLDSGSDHDLHVREDLSRGTASGEADSGAGAHAAAAVAEHAGPVDGRPRPVAVGVLYRPVTVRRERAADGGRRRRPISRTQHHAARSPADDVRRRRRVVATAAHEARA